MESTALFQQDLNNNYFRENPLDRPLNRLKSDTKLLRIVGYGLWVVIHARKQNVFLCNHYKYIRVC